MPLDVEENTTAMLDRMLKAGELEFSDGGGAEEVHFHVL